MQIPYSFECIECKLTAFGVAHITAAQVHCKCSCGYDNCVGINTTIRTGIKLLYKAGYELGKNHDFTLSILLSVMAFEGEQYRLYKKWFVLDELQQKKYISPEDADREVRKIFLNAKEVRNKINLTVRKGSDLCFNDYVGQCNDLISALQVLRPDADKKDPWGLFHDALFTSRNDILHGAKFNYSKEEAEAVYSMSWIGMNILWDIDLRRQNKKRRLKVVRT